MMKKLFAFILLSLFATAAFAQNTVTGSVKDAVTGEPLIGVGVIVSTGGGAVLRPENVTALKQNGRLFWLDRDPDALIPTDDRPLADTADKIRTLYRERYPVYQSAADEIMPVHDVPEKIAKIILSAFDLG